MNDKVHVELLGTLGCHLCDEAEELVHLSGVPAVVTLVKVDIAEKDDLVAVYGERIPVLRVLTDNTGSEPTVVHELDWPFSLLDLTVFWKQVSQ